MNSSIEHDPIHRRRILGAGAALAVLAPMASHAQTVSPPPRPNTERSMQIGGAAIGQFGHLVATGWAKAVTHAPGYRATPVATSGFVENAQLIGQGKMQFGWVAGLTMDQTRAGDESVITKAELAKMRGVFTLPAGAHHVVVLADSPIRRLEDLKGKRISGFGRGSLGWTYVSDILSLVGIGKSAYREEPLGPSQAIQALKDRKVDVVWGTGNPPNASIVELAATHKFRLIAIPPDVLSKLEAMAPSWQRALIPKGVYNNVEPNEDVASVQQTQIATTSTAVDADMVYAATWAVMEHLGDFWSVHPGAKLLTLQTALDGLPIPLHAGAVRYYRARGIALPDRLIPPEAR
jgi:TRAP transporter TAXI family solute receptor